MLRAKSVWQPGSDSAMLDWEKEMEESLASIDAPLLPEPPLHFLDVDMNAVQVRKTFLNLIYDIDNPGTASSYFTGTFSDLHPVQQFFVLVLAMASHANILTDAFVVKKTFKT